MDNLPLYRKYIQRQNRRRCYLKGQNEEENIVTNEEKNHNVWQSFTEQTDLRKEEKDAKYRSINQICKTHIRKRSKCTTRSCSCCERTNRGSGFCPNFSKGSVCIRCKKCAY